LSNVIKLRNPVAGVRIEHRFGTLGQTALGRPDTDEDQQDDRSFMPRVDEYARGFEAGKTEAAERLTAEYEDRLALERKRADALVANLYQQFVSLHDRWEQSAMQFAFSVAQVILKREASVDRDVVLPQVREAIRRLVGAENVKIRVNPCDEEILRSRRAEVVSVSDSLRDMVIETDVKIEPGGCIVESDLGNVDARLSTQIKKIEMVLFDQKSLEIRQ
jgi:flagellar assembly protein FliH